MLSAMPGDPSDHPDTKPTEPGTPSIRVHGFHVPRRLGLRGLLMSVGTAAATFPLALLAISSFEVGRDALGPEWQIARFPASVLIALGSGILVAGISLHHRRRSSPPGRIRRLRWLCRDRAGALSRFPHRLLELKLRGLGLSRTALRQAASAHPHGMVLMMNPPAPAAALRMVQANQRAFDPVDLANTGQVDRFLGRMLDEREDHSTEPEQPNGAPPRGIPWGQFLRAWVSSTEWWGFPILALVYILYRATGRVDPLWVVNLVLLTLIPLGVTLLVRDEWRLIPGGLVLKRRRLWRRRIPLERYHPHSSVLLIRSGGWDGHAALISDGLRTRKVVWPAGHSGLPILLAWLSTAPPPTDKQLLDFFAAGGEMPELIGRNSDQCGSHVS